MPCFRGLAVSIHTPDGPLSEHHIVKQAKFSRITTYIPVPPPKVSANLDKPEQSTFAISITLLTPGLNVPYSTAKPTTEDPNPRPKIVGGSLDSSAVRGKIGPVIGPYVPLTASSSETIAAYIYFDGRAKEEVATLLRRGEETWVNSRWVSIPDSEGGGLAEREFIFREVGLERWLNGLDLKGSTQDVQARIQRRREKLAKKRVKKETEDDDPMADIMKRRRKGSNGVLRYGGDKNAPVETLSDDNSDSSDSDSDAEAMPEAAGQIKVALFRVIASGEIKKGEYSPQFDVHDDDDEANASGGGGGGDADVDHTTSFAKPKSLDPKSISTQTVTGIDPPDKPYAVFTFFYRGDRQLRKMGIVGNAQSSKTPAAVKKESTLPDFSKMGPLKTAGKKVFEGYRDSKSDKSKKVQDEDAMDSDAEDDDPDDNVLRANESTVHSRSNGDLLSPEDAMRDEALTEGVRKIRLKRQHSTDPLEAGSPNPSSRSPDAQTTPQPGDVAVFEPADDHHPSINNNVGPTSHPNTDSQGGVSIPPSAIPSTLSTSPSTTIGSPFKKQRASMSGIEDKFLDKFRKFPSVEAAAALGSNAPPRRESDGNVLQSGSGSSVSGGNTLQSSSSVSGLGLGPTWSQGQPGNGMVSKLELGPPIEIGDEKGKKAEGQGGTIVEEGKMDEEEL